MLTKAFVVLVTVLAILLVALTVSSVARYEDLNAQLAEMRSSRDQAMSTANLRESDLAETTNRFDQELADREDQIRELTDRITALSSQYAEARDAAAEARSDLETWEASLARLTAAEALTQEMNKSLTSELERRREESVQLQTRLVESASRIAELSTQSDSLERQVRRFREQMQAMNAANEEMLDEIASLPPEVRRMLDRESEGQTGGVTPAQPIAGQIVQLEREGQDVFAQVNVGSNDGVAERMEFMVHRDDQYLGKLVIDSVESDAAVGHMTLIQDDVQTGDAIFAGRL